MSDAWFHVVWNNVKRVPTMGARRTKPLDYGRLYIACSQGEIVGCDVSTARAIQLFVK